MSADILILPFVTVERHRSDDEVFVRIALPRATARTLQTLAHTHSDGDLALCIVDILRHCAEVIDEKGSS